MGSGLAHRRQPPDSANIPCLFLNNIIQLSEHIRTGRLDFMLLAAHQFTLHCFPENRGPGLVCECAVRGRGHVLCGSPTQPWAEYHASVWVPNDGRGRGVDSLLTHVSLGERELLDRQGARDCLGATTIYLNIARLPDAAFRGFFKVFFTFAVPMLLVANVPLNSCGKVELARWDVMAGIDDLWMPIGLRIGMALVGQILHER